MTQRARFALAAVLFVLPSSGCGSGNAPEGTVAGNASCVLALVFDGHTYLGDHAGPAVVQGASLGRATLPPCNDTGPSTDTGEVEEIEVAAVEGISPSIAVVWVGREGDVFVRDDVDRGSLPSGIVGP